MNEKEKWQPSRGRTRAFVHKQQHISLALSVTIHHCRLPSTSYNLHTLIHYKFFSQNAPASNDFHRADTDDDLGDKV